MNGRNVQTTIKSIFRLLFKYSDIHLTFYYISKCLINEYVQTSSVLLYATFVDSRSSSISALSRFMLEETSEDVADDVAKSNKAETFLADVSVDVVFLGLLLV